MKKETKEIKQRVKLEKELQDYGVEHWSAGKRRRVARKIRRWARQLEVSAFILDRDQAQQPRPSLKVLPMRKLVLN